VRVLDLFCGEGGASVGYARAGHEVTGVDFVSYMGGRYPYRFHCGDALEFLDRYGHRFDLIHASPPCQAYSVATRRFAERYADLVEPTRTALQALGKPYVIENVMGAPLNDPTMLCWTMFHSPMAVDNPVTPLQMERHRLFETNWLLGGPGPCRHAAGVVTAGAYAGGTKNPSSLRGGYVPRKHVLEVLMGIDWMSKRGIHQAIPPSYTEYIGKMATEEVFDA
jgi:DNA (cytosine-5)-methyltransferase 1